MGENGDPSPQGVRSRWPGAPAIGAPALLLAAAYVMATTLQVQGQRRAEPPPGPEGEWAQTGGLMSNARYSTLARITATNVKTLGGAWTTGLSGTARQITPVCLAARCT